MMKSIEERARDFSIEKCCTECKHNSECKNNKSAKCALVLRYDVMYQKIAKEQQEITKQEMICKAKQWLKENVDNYLYNTGGFEEYVPKCGDKMFNDFEKAMLEELV